MIEAHLALTQELKDKSLSANIGRLFMEICPNDRGVIEAPIGRSEKDRKKQAVNAKGKLPQ